MMGIVVGAIGRCKREVAEALAKQDEAFGVLLEKLGVSAKDILKATKETADEQVQ